MTETAVRVLESFQTPRKVSNPYIVMLFEALKQGGDVRAFSWREALIGNYNVFHVHWPEVLLSSPRRSRRIAKRGLFALLLVRLSARRVAVVRTMHNVAPHEEPSRIDNRLIARLNAITTAWIRLNPTTEVGDRSDVTTILLGHYLDWFSEAPERAAQPGRIGNFGLIRPYKGVSELVSAFRSSDSADLRLIVMGEPSTPELRDEIRTLAADDPRITLSLTHVDDDQLAEEIRSCSVIVLPHSNMHNSSSLLLALSLDRPALVPTTAVTQDLQSEVGSQWVYLYDGTLTAAVLEEAARRASEPRESHPDLSRRDWSNVAAEHFAVFRRALRTRRTTNK